MQAATPLAAVFQFFVRDLAGMLGGVLFAFMQVCRFHYLHCSGVVVWAMCSPNAGEGCLRAAWLACRGLTWTYMPSRCDVS